MTFTISFSDATDNTDGTFTLNGVCNFHHIQTGSYVTIDGNPYRVLEYSLEDETIKVRGTEAISVTSFTLRTPFFCHGTPMQQEAELVKIKVNVKTPMIYLMEPYDTSTDFDPFSSIDRTVDCTICFLTQAKTLEWQTDDFYYNSISPMQSLMEDFLEAVKKSNLFFNDRLNSSSTIHTKFGINIRDTGTKKAYFSENLSGVSLDLHLEIYRVEDCKCDHSDDEIPVALGEFSDDFNEDFNI